jgi:hypothetical protein
MVDDRLEDAGSLPDSGRVKRAPPTIDLDPAEISSETKPGPGVSPEAKFESKFESNPDAGPDIQPEPAPASRLETGPEPEPIGSGPERPKGAASNSRSVSRSISPWVIAPFSGAVGAALVIAVGWMLGWPPVQPPPAGPQATAINDLTARVAGLEAKSGKPVLDAAVTARLDALEKSSSASRSDLASLRAQSDKTAAAVNEVKSAPRDAGSAIDVAALNERIAQIERAGTAPAAQQSAKPADDVPLRLVVAAALLDVAVRHGDPYAAALAAAKSLAPNPDALKSLDQFAATGVPNPPMLGRELLTLVPKLSPTPLPDNPTTGTSIVDRLQSGAAKLVRIERTDAVGTDRGAIVTRVTAAALRNDLAEARRELLTLAPADRAPAQGWLDKVAAHEAALAASRQFAADAMAVLAKPAQ